MNTFITEELSLEIHKVLKETMEKSSARAIYFTDRGGYMIGQHSAQDIPLEDNLVALIAGAFYASQQAAQLLGEPEFESMSEKGKNCSIYVIALNSDHVLITVFGPETTIGLVKLYCKEAVDRINPSLENTQKDGAGPAVSFEMNDAAPVFQVVSQKP